MATIGSDKRDNSQIESTAAFRTYTRNRKEEEEEQRESEKYGTNNKHQLFLSHKISCSKFFFTNLLKFILESMNKRTYPS